MKVIIGAGLSGLICGALNAQAQIYERNSPDFVSHRALLRFRDDKIAKSIGIEFKKVRVRKGIWHHGNCPGPSPHLANMYSQKVRGVLTEASIWDLEHSDRFIAPDNLHQILSDICGNRVCWEETITADRIGDWREAGSHIVNTSPLPKLLEMLCVPTDGIQFNFAPISVSRYHIPDCDVYQTIYFPDPAMGMYRASITGSLLTIESVAMVPSNTDIPQVELETALEAFGIKYVTTTPERISHKQSYGKILPVDNLARKALLHRLTQDWGIWSLGRFGTWRNILLDDVYEDIAHIRRMQQQTLYDYSLERNKR